MITVTRVDGVAITDFIFTMESFWKRDGKMIVHEIPGSTEDKHYPNGTSSAGSVLSGRCRSTEANNTLLASMLHKYINVSSTARGTHSNVLVTSVSISRDDLAWLYFNLSVVT